MLKKIWNKFNKCMMRYVDQSDYRYAKRQSEIGNKHGQFLLARMYETGNDAVKQDRVSAYVLYYIADQKGVKEAKHCLECLKPKLLPEEWQEAKTIIREKLCADKPNKDELIERKHDE
ncbi:MAG: hypothetical protein COV52_09680 [Gammaproteobacteria bacterium CG11_big_fil_rev_8_21_14_0_20_46_22]|nr:MAG: hypothetical protein COV52_09680 [Gammaproteobacteria bacterium CG11_big_fil_rev_8_21_14_0_20_46_22]